MISEVYNIDCIEFMQQFPDKHFELAIVDPPYGIGINVNMGRRKGEKKSSYHKFYGEDKSIPNEKYFVELNRVSKNQIIWGGNFMTKYLEHSSCWILWDKGFSEEVTFGQFELAWTSFTTTHKKFDRSPNQNNRIHPTQKPVDLYRWLLQNYADQGDKILDTHLGSGSSRIACDMEGFDFYGCELDHDYFEAHQKRWNEYKKQLKLF